ncbi:hypothetical protein [Nannocystis pusilla]|uniref:Uncharacterized protein n=1 Tax=Nannocystis pusilla TaxID=889268 RepID=A0ABS7U085_9BACT|nr:hypothetical protein [Nannocystis pusilla]MBZ5713883.1 hypothetical protein [Nannocystis pusilla]
MAEIVAIEAARLAVSVDDFAFRPRRPGHKVSRRCTLVHVDSDSLRSRSSEGRERRPDEVQLALREPACELTAHGAGDEGALRLSTPARADEAQTGAVAAAWAAVRRDHPEVRELAALARPAWTQVARRQP